MKNKSQFIVETAVTIIIAGILSVVLTLILAFVAQSLGVYDASYVNIISGVVFGVVLGYKMNSLIRDHNA